MFCFAAIEANKESPSRTRADTGEIVGLALEVNVKAGAVCRVGSLGHAVARNPPGPGFALRPDEAGPQVPVVPVPRSLGVLLRLTTVAAN